MSEYSRAACELCQYPSEAGHAIDCPTKTSAVVETETNKPEHSFEDLTVELNKAGLDKTNLLSSCTPENFLGQGGNAEVYTISGVEKYVLKISNSRRKDTPISGEIIKVDDKFPEFNIGQAVGEVTGEGILLLRKQAGIPAGVPYGEIRKNQEKGDLAYEEHLKRASEMPQAAYDEFAKMLLIINERNHKFDPSKASNILVDVEANRFNMVDINENESNSNYQNNVGELVVVLMDNSYAWKYKGNIPLDNYRKIILEKCIEAGKRVGWEVPAVGISSSLDYSFKLAGESRTNPTIPSATTPENSPPIDPSEPW